MPSQSLGKILRKALFGALAFTSVSIVAGGCLDRPVAPVLFPGEQSCAALHFFSFRHSFSPSAG